MTISALTKALSILAVSVILVGLSVYMRKPATPVPQQAAIQGAPKTATTLLGTDPWTAALSAVKECKIKRLGGELKTYVQSATCSNPGIVQAFIAVNYKHLDLIQAFAAKRLELAEKLDRGQITEAQSERELLDFSNRIRNDDPQWGAPGGGSRALDLGTDADRLRWPWLRGVSPEVTDCHSP
jgi:hypothetical protein